MAKYRKTSRKPLREVLLRRCLQSVQERLYQILKELDPGLYTVRLDVEVCPREAPRWTVNSPAGGPLFTNG